MPCQRCDCSHATCVRGATRVCGTAPASGCASAFVKTVWLSAPTLSSSQRTPSVCKTCARTLAVHAAQCAHGPHHHKSKPGTRQKKRTFAQVGTRPPCCSSSSLCVSLVCVPLSVCLLSLALSLSLAPCQLPFLCVRAGQGVYIGSRASAAFARRHTHPRCGVLLVSAQDCDMCTVGHVVVW